MTLPVDPPARIRALSEFQAYGRELVPQGTDVLDEFLEERRAAAQAEEVE